MGYTGTEQGTNQQGSPSQERREEERQQATCDHEDCVQLGTWEELRFKWPLSPCAVWVFNRNCGRQWRRAKPTLRWGRSGMEIPPTSLDMRLVRADLVPTLEWPIREGWKCGLTRVQPPKPTSRPGWRLGWYGTGPDPQGLLIQGRGPALQSCTKRLCSSGDEAQGLHCVPGVLPTAEGCTAISGNLLLPWLNQWLCPALAAGFKRLIVV